MTKLVLVILSMAFLAVSIPSALSAGTSCTNQKTCLSKSECCVTVKGSKSKTCETVTAGILNTTFATLQPLPGVGGFAKTFKSTIIDKLNPNVPLTLNSELCKSYALALGFIANGGLSKFQTIPNPFG